MTLKPRRIGALIFVLGIALLSSNGFSVSDVLGKENDTITVWFDNKSSENNELRQIANNFTQETGIKVEIVERRSVFDAPADFVNSAETRDRPDIVFMQAPDIGNLVRSGYIEPVVITEDIRSRYSQDAIDAFTLDGICYGIGYSIESSGLLYNKDLISSEELPQTWEDFWDVARDLTSETIRGTLLHVKDIWFNYPIIQEYGGYYYGVDENGIYNPYDIGLNNEGMLEYISVMKQAMKDGLTLTSESEMESHISNEFSHGRVAMILYGLWNASIYQARGLNYGIAPLPRHSDGSPSKPLSTVVGFVINAFSQKKESAKAFYEYIYRDENQQRLIEAGNAKSKKTGERIPGNISVKNSTYVQSHEILRTLSELETQPFPNIPEGPIWYNYAPTSLKSIFFYDSDPKAALDELAELIYNDVLRINKKPAQPVISINAVIYISIGITLALIAAAICICIRSYKKLKRMNALSRTRMRLTPVGWFLVLPLLVLIGVFYVFPIVHNLFLSFTNFSGTTMRDYVITGLENYKTIFTTGISGFISMIVWTLSFATLVVGFSFVIGAAMSMILNKVKAKVSKIYRLIYILPWVIPSVLSLLMWNSFLADSGTINAMLGYRVPWLTNKWLARTAAVTVMVSISFPYYMLVALSFILAIPVEYFEAGKIEGAGSVKLFFKITLPILFNAMLPMLIMGFLLQFNQFGLYLLTYGEPKLKPGQPGATDLLITYVFNLANNTKDYSLAAAYSVIIFIFMALFAMVTMRINRNQKEF